MRAALSRSTACRSILATCTPSTYFEAPGEGANIVEGRMGPTAYLGDRSHFHVLIPGREQPIAVAVQNRDSSAVLAASKQPIWLSYSRESVVLLQPD